ncbi:NAD(P)/FAD-dependent oxidoreductase [Marinobacterium jannaschii]|uniref:NAD(P)/FAD-dependent oxidoreductase n=1 Tax=Marinobacterium jannaschii TaxID=64970 RepID=UPI0004862EBE|nr:FAD-binding oxidoreductase [Marinobacterium jannaschii]
MYHPDSEHSADTRSQTVAVIGAGVVGLCTALEAQRRGYQVTLIDRDQPGLGASYGNAGYLATELIDPLSTLKTLKSAPAMWLNPHGPLAIPLGYLHRIAPWLLRFVAAALPRNAQRSQQGLQALNRASVAAWERCLEDIGATEQLVRSGYLLVWESAAKLDQAKTHARYLAEQGIRTELVMGERLAQLEPALAETSHHALYFPDASRVQEPYRLCMQLYAAFKARGGYFLQQAVEAVSLSGNEVSLETTGGALAFGRAIVCAGAWSKSLLQSVGIEVPLEAERGYHLTIDARTGLLNHPIGSAERRFVMTPLESGLRVVGFTELGGLARQPQPRRFRSLRHHSRALLTPLKDESLATSEWMGHRPTLPDSLPVIDMHPDHSQLLFAFGNQHLGLTQAAITAEMVVALMTGDEPSIDPEPFRVDRF